MKDSKTQSFNVSDFNMEIDLLFNHECLLFEGYMYTNEDNEKVFLVTDFLLKNSQVVDCDYALRYALINEMFAKLNLKKLNNHLTIGIHPMFKSENETLLKVFMDNFVFARFLCSREKILSGSYSKTKTLVCDDSRDNVPCEKWIEQGPYSDVYNVFNVTTRNREGILYVKGIRESEYLRNMFNGKDTVKCLCVYNKVFHKFQIVL
jgi:hypothetical protein